MKRWILAMAVLCLAGIPSAHAIVYVGASGGQTTLESEEMSINFDGDDTGWKGFVGVNILKFFGVEAAYLDLGAPEDTSGGFTLTTELKGWQLQLLGRLPLWKFELFAKAGVIGWDADATLTGFGSFGDDGTDLAYGVGGKFKFGDHFAIRAEWEGYDIQDVDTVYLVSAGLEFGF